MGPDTQKTAYRVLYLFSGVKRKATVKHYVMKLAKQYDIKIIFEEVDILRSRRRHDLRPAT